MEEHTALDLLSRNKRKILITGGSGLLAGRIGRELGHKGYTVVLASRKRLPITGEPFKQSVIDWSDTYVLEDLCKETDYIIHCAGINAQGCCENPRIAVEVNCKMAASLAARARAAGVSKFIYFSTAHVYGSPLQGMITEETLPQNDHPYATSKLAGEKAVLNLAATNFEPIVLRLSNVIACPLSEHSNDINLLFNQLTRDAVQTNSVTISGQLKSTRDFLPASILCDHIAQILDETAYSESILNVGSGFNMTVKDAVDLVRNIHFVMGGKNYKQTMIAPQSNTSSGGFQFRSKLPRTDFKTYRYNLYRELIDLYKSYQFPD